MKGSECGKVLVRACLAVVVLFSATDIQAKDRRPVVTFQLPKQAPSGVPVLCAGWVTSGRLKSTVLQVWDGQVQPTWAQYDRLTGRVWAFLPNDVGQPGCLRSLWASPACPERWVRVERKEAGLQVYDGDRPVLFYQTKPHSLDGGVHVTANYVHPLLGLDGETLTYDFPPDHRHHHGVFWAWHQLWVGQRRVGDSWVDKDFLPVVRRVDVVDQGPLFATLQSTVHWTSPLVTDQSGQQVPFVEEHTTIRVFRAVGDYQYVDFRIELVPLLEDVKIGGSEDFKEYSGFTVRLKAPKDIVIATDRERLQKDAVQARARWADVTGVYEGGRSVTGVAILSSPRLPEFPPRWLLRHYGAQNVIYPGRKPVTLPTQPPLVLRHRLVIHRGRTEPAQIEAHQRLFEEQEQQGTD